MRFVSYGKKQHRAARTVYPHTIIILTVSISDRFCHTAYFFFFLPLYIPFIRQVYTYIFVCSLLFYYIWIMMVLSDNCALYSYRPLHTILIRRMGLGEGNKQLQRDPRVLILLIFPWETNTFFTLCYSANSV